MGERLSQEQRAMYRQTALARENARREASTARRLMALEIARRAAELLKREYGATRVLVYGSTAHGQWYSSRSDIDLLVEGIPAELYWRAWNAVDALERDFEVNLVDWEDATPALRTTAEQEGIAL